MATGYDIFMEVKQDHRVVVKSAEFPSKKFSIALNGTAFAVLSSKLYKNEILAIVRELSTNASDAHVEAGTQAKQFDVHLPNTFEPFFSIRDYGTGLSDQAIEEVYTTYFNSTRTNSNSFTGGFGLGSKTPFAYTDQFTIVSWFNGIQYTYSAFKDESGEPCISPLGMVETIEPNGVSIRVNVAGKDIAAFVESARRVYQFFKVRPNITGATMTFDDAIPVAEENDSYQMYESGKGSDLLYGKVNLVMGQVCYAADGDGIVTGELGSYGFIVIFAPVGACDIQVSREELQYTDKTKQYLNSRIRDALADARKKLEAKVGQTDTLLARMQAVSRFRNLVSFPDSSCRLELVLDKGYKCVGLEVHGGKLSIYRERQWIDANFGCNYLFIENDLPADVELRQGDKNRLRQYILNNRGGMYYLATIEDRAAFEKQFGVPVAKLSTLPAVPVNRTAGFSVDRQYIKRLRPDAWRHAETWGKISDIDNSKGIAVPKRGAHVIFGGKESRELSVYIAIAKLLGYQEVYGISAPCYKRLRAEYELEDLETEARKYIDRYMKNGGQYQFAHLQHGIPTKEGNSYEKNRPSPQLLKEIDGLSEQCNDVAAMCKTHAPSDVHQWLIRYFGLTIPDASNYFSAFFARYPLLRRVELDDTDKDFVSQCLEYIYLIEKDKA
jgi:hypothetical protein